jgi:hypothetical protein
MAFPADNWFRKLIEDALENTAAIDLNADTIKAALFTDSITGTFNFDTNTGYGSAPWNANEVVGAGYTTGGATLASPGVTVAGGIVTFDAGDASWTTATITARGCLVQDTTVSMGIVALNFGSDKVSSAGNFTVQFAGTGILAFS